MLWIQSVFSTPLITWTWLGVALPFQSIEIFLYLSTIIYSFVASSFHMPDTLMTDEMYYDNTGTTSIQPGRSQGST